MSNRLVTQGIVRIAIVINKIHSRIFVDFV